MLSRSKATCQTIPSETARATGSRLSSRCYSLRATNLCESFVLGKGTVELSTREKTALGQIEMLIRQGKSETEAAETLKVLLVGEEELVEKVVTFRHEVAEQRRTIATDHAIFDPEEEGEPWYGGPGEYDVFWPDLRAALVADPSWVDAVPSLDDACGSRKLPVLFSVQEEL